MEEQPLQKEKDVYPRAPCQPHHHGLWCDVATTGGESLVQTDEKRGWHPLLFFPCALAFFLLAISAIARVLRCGGKERGRKRGRKLQAGSAGAVDRYEGTAISQPKQWIKEAHHNKLVLPQHLACWKLQRRFVTSGNSPEVSIFGVLGS